MTAKVSSASSYDLERMTDSNYEDFCLREAQKDVKEMSNTDYFWQSIKTLYYLSPLLNIETDIPA